VYVLEQDSSRIQVFNADGQFLFMWGEIGNGDGEFRDPFDIAVDEQGNIYVSDYQNDRIQMFRLVTD
jgi:DNA-binding beta-propeller fold protein YncE